MLINKKTGHDNKARRLQSAPGKRFLLIKLDEIRPLHGRLLGAEGTGRSTHQYFASIPDRCTRACGQQYKPYYPSSKIKSFNRLFN
jgi:hypothetical protein